MKTYVLSLLLLSTGCSTIASGTQPADPSSTHSNAASASELPRQLADLGGAAKQAEPTFDVVGGHLTMSDPGDSSKMRQLWPIAKSPLLWTRFVSYAGGGYAVVLRQRDAILVGTLDAERNPLAELARIPARHVIGAPAVAASGDVAFVAWAQGESTGCTSLVGTTFGPGERPGPAHLISGTECSEDRSARAPVLSSTPEGGFVLAFTEIGVWSSQAVAMHIHPAHKTGLDAAAMNATSGDVVSRLGL
jgi:hypothetical protein